MSRRTWQKALPSAYAREKCDALVSRWARTLGDELRRQVPIAWPGAPETVFLGFTAFALRDENTGEATDPKRRAPFDEVGYFQTERTRPFTRNKAAKYNAWVKLHDSELVVRLLGRPATMDPEGWRGERGVPDQVAVGLANLRRHLGNARAKLDPRLRPVDETSTWAVLCAMTAFSRGAGGLAAVTDPYADKLAAYPEPARWAAWEGMVAADIAKRLPGIGSKTGKKGAGHAILRTRQKHDSGRAAAEALGLPVDWYLPVDDHVGELVARASADDLEALNDHDD